MNEPDLRRHIGLPSAVLLVIGSVIGSGIFLTSGLMLDLVPTAGELMAMWLLGGLLSLCGCFVFAELGAMLPAAGGLYVYLDAAYGPRIAFLFGWSSLVIILSGQIASIGLGFAEYVAYFVPSLATHSEWARLDFGSIGTWTLSSRQVLAVVTILALGAINMFRLQGSRDTAAYLTFLKVLAMLVLAGLILIAAGGISSISWTLDLDTRHFSSYGLALIPVLYTYEGWAYLSFAASEVRDPGKTMPRAYFIGMSAIIALYLLMNVAYLAAAPADSLRGVLRVGEVAATASMGPIGGMLLSATALLSTLGCIAAMIFVAARVFFAMARRGALFASLGHVHPIRGTPDRAVLLVTVWSAVLVLSGTYEQLLTFVTFAVLLFSIAGGLALFVLRAKLPDAPRPYHALGYPVLPGLFVLTMTALAVNVLIERPRESLLGLLLVGLGLPIYAFMARRQRTF